MARQLRLRLVAGDESDIPRNLHNIVVSIHAIATIQALHDYLRPRVAGLLLSGRQSGMLVTAPGFTHGSSSRDVGEELQQAQPASNPPVDSGAVAVASPGSIGRRRSLRLKAKHGGTSPGAVEGNPAAMVAFGTTEASASDPPSLPVFHAANLVTSTPSDTVVDSELQAEFASDEVDAEVSPLILLTIYYPYRIFQVLDDDADPDNSVSEKTVTLSVAEGITYVGNSLPCADPAVKDGFKVEAQTPDGIRVTTPNVLPNSTPQSSARTSYAAALKTKPTDWHLEFSMDDQILPLDLTIYGAIHQHEMRKKPGTIPQSLVWQGVYNVTFKKVSGPTPTPESEYTSPLRSNRADHRV